jgi:uncharacterized protein YbgA (DUF1722 family)/uncharacterized protein YbbK (DUF523 family)
MTAERFDERAGPAAAGHDGAADSPIRVGISACLLGEKVRFDGGHKRDSFLTDVLGRFVEFVPVCPEVDAGFGTPREAMRLARVDGSIRLVTVKTDRDVTAPMERLVRRRVPSLEAEQLSGYVLKKNSPSCGLERVKVYDRNGVPSASGRGVFAEALVQRYPQLPVEEEGRLSDPRLRENFVERVFAYNRLRTLFRGTWTLGALVAFHTAHKLILMSHSPVGYRRLGRLVASARARRRADVRQQYGDEFMQTMGALATCRKHTNVLQHMAGYFKNRLDRESKVELQQTIEDYRRGLIPLIVPITILQHHVRVHGVEYLAGQLYLQPHPKELMLRITRSGTGLGRPRPHGRVLGVCEDLRQGASE